MYQPYSNALTKDDSVYRIPYNEQPTTKDGDSEDSTAKKEERVAPTTIRNLRTKSVGTNHLPNPDPNSLPQEEGKGGEATEEVESTLGYTENELKQDRNKRGAALAGIPADQYAKLTGGQDQAEQQETAQRRAEVQQIPIASARPMREVPVTVENAITEFAEQYDDAHLLRSDVTRAAKIYFTAVQTLEYFNDTLFFAFLDQARAAALKKSNCAHTNGRGHVNRVPFFFTCLENAFSFSLEELVYLRAEDPLYSDYSLWDVIDTIRDNYHRLFNTGQITEDYRTWLCDILDDLEKRKAPKQRINQTIRS